RVSAGSIRFDIQATQSGCKAIALSVWNGSGNRPLDHLVYEFSVHTPGEKPPDCGIEDHPLRGGLGTLLESMISGDVNRRIEADAGLHIFEIKSYGVTTSHAVYMQREMARTGKQLPDGGSADLPHRNLNPLFVRSWTLPQPLSVFLANPDKLEAHVAKAREKARQLVQVKEKSILAYDDVAQALASAIFNSPTPGDGNPTEALAALDDLTKTSAHRIVLMTRLVSVENRTFFLPLGLLSARGNNQVLSRPVTIVQQMANQRVTREAPCIGSWAFAIPSHLDGVPDKLDLPQVASNAPWFIGWLSDKATLEHYVDGTLHGASQL